MKWLQGNPIGVALAAISGVFLLIALGMVIVWTLPVSVDVADSGSENTVASNTILTAGKIGVLRDYQVITEKPLFNESRLPVIDVPDDELSDGEGIDEEIAVKDAPEVRLTGVIITPSMKIASLSPVDESLESVMAHEGESLVGEYVGWQVSAVKPRKVVLESRDGRKLELELQVHDVKIKEPPKPAVAAPAQPVQAAQAEPEQTGADVDEDDEPLSRAEQIRQRIAERREELRREQEQQQSRNDRREKQPKSAAKPSGYQSAIQEMMKKSRKDQSNNDKEDG